MQLLVPVLCVFLIYWCRYTEHGIYAVYPHYIRIPFIFATFAIGHFIANIYGR